MKFLAFFIIATLLGCAAPRPWTKPGAGEREFQISVARCRMHAAGLPEDPHAARGSQSVQLGRAMENLGSRMQFMNDCLRADGWTQ